MTRKSPFHSRPPLRPQPDEEEEQIIEGVMEPPQALVPIEEVEEPADPSASSRQRRVRAPRVAQPGAFWLALILIVGGIFFTLMNVSSLSDQVLKWWPVTVLVGAGLWAFIALLRRDVRAFLAGAGSLGLGISLLLEAHEVATFEETVVGAILITLGMGVVVRGLLMRSAVSTGR